MPHVYIGPYPSVLGNGRPVAVDEVIAELDCDEPHNAALLAKGWLAESVAASITKAKPTGGDA